MKSSSIISVSETKKAVTGRNKADHGYQVPPRGVQVSNKSAEKPQGAGRGAAKSAAFDADLTLVIERWGLLKPHGKITIMGIVRSAKKRC
jgi:hypothetical protein